MKIFLPARHGLGDVLYEYFGHYEGILYKKFRQVLDARNKRQVSDIVVFYEHFMNPAIAELFSYFSIKAIPTSDVVQYGVIEATGNNAFPDDVNGYKNILKSDLSSFEELEIDLPMDPRVSKEKPFICYHPFAGDKERFLNSFDITQYGDYVLIGRPIKRTDMSIPLKLQSSINTWSLATTFSYLQQSSVIVSSLSWLRTMAKIFNKIVIEIYEGSNPDTIERTNKEYTLGDYGITSKINNFWFKYPEQKDELDLKIKEFL